MSEGETELLGPRDIFPNVNEGEVTSDIEKLAFQVASEIMETVFEKIRAKDCYLTATSAAALKPSVVESETSNGKISTFRSNSTRRVVTVALDAPDSLGMTYPEERGDSGRMTTFRVPLTMVSYFVCEIARNLGWTWGSVKMLRGDHRAVNYEKPLSVSVSEVVSIGEE